MELRLEGSAELGYDPMGNPPKGEICLRGPMVFAGYYKDPEKTKEAFGASAPWAPHHHASFTSMTQLSRRQGGFLPTLVAWSVGGPTVAESASSPAQKSVVYIRRALIWHMLARGRPTRAYLQLM